MPIEEKEYAACLLNVCACILIRQQNIFTEGLLPAEFLLCSADFLLLYLLHWVPALLRHFLVNLVLHAECVVERLRERAMNIRCRRFDCSMHH